MDSAEQNWIFFDFDQGDDATDLEGVSGPGAERDGVVAGALVAKYVEAYNSNSDTIMSAFIAASFDESHRASKIKREHLDLYRLLFDKHSDRSPFTKWSKRTKPA